ncbi:hypothetical protein ES703_61450 [subsurface metagenome]
MNCYQFCKECLHLITILKTDSIKMKCKLTDKNNNYIYKNGSPIKCTKFKLKNNKGGIEGKKKVSIN